MVLAHMYPNPINPNLGISIQQRVKHLAARGCQLTVVSPVPWSPTVLWYRPRWRGYGQVPARSQHDGIDVYYPRYLRPPGRWFRPLSGLSLYLALRLFECAVPFCADLLQSHTLIPDGYATTLWGRYLRRPVVCYLEGSDVEVYPQESLLTRWASSFVLKNADQVVAVSHSLKVSAEGLAVPRQEIQVIHNGVDTQLFSPCRKTINWRGGHGLPTDALLVLFVGHIYFHKGVYELLDAFQIVNQRLQEAHLVIVGTGVEAPRAKRLAHERGLDGRVHWLGQRPHAEVAQWMSAADLLVLPSHNEGLPGVILEAMACQLPVVASRVGGIPEIVEHGKTGLLVDKLDVPALAEAIMTLLTNAEWRMEMGQRGRQIVLERFSWEKNVESAMALYRQLITASGATGVRGK